LSPRQTSFSPPPSPPNIVSDQDRFGQIDGNNPRIVVNTESETPFDESLCQNRLQRVLLIYWYSLLQTLLFMRNTVRVLARDSVSTQNAPRTVETFPQRESVVVYGTRFSNLYTAVDTPAEAA
jgi:hypothetical protein